MMSFVKIRPFAIIKV